MRASNEIHRNAPSHQHNNFNPVSMTNIGLIQKNGGGDALRPTSNNITQYSGQQINMISSSIPYRTATNNIPNDFAYQQMMRSDNLRNLVQPQLSQPYSVNYAPIEMPQCSFDTAPPSFQMENLYYGGSLPYETYLTNTTQYQNVVPSVQPPLVFGPPPRRSSARPANYTSESIPIESIFESYSNRMSSVAPEIQSGSVRPDIKLKFSKNVVNIPKKIEVHDIDEGQKKFTPMGYSSENHSSTPFCGQEDNAFVDMILEGCLYGEEIATKYQNVPCFKNIKKLCEKTKSDLMTPHCTARNIHSQGIPWATKDYIFAFTRLTSCWYLLKGYLGHKSDVFDKIEQLYSPQLRSSFEAWEQTTSNLAFHIMQSFVALGNPSHTPKVFINRKMQHDEDLKKYIEPGCYPVPQYIPFKKTPQGILTSALMKRSRDESESKSLEEGAGDWEGKIFHKMRMEKRNTCVKKAHKSFYNAILSTQQPQCSEKQQPNEGVSKLASETFQRILNELWNMRSSHYFVFEVDVRDLPDYYSIIKNPMCLSIILQKLQQFKYKSLFQVVQDFRNIFRNARVYLNVHPDKRLERIINNFSSTFERLLAEYFPRLDFSEINGELYDVTLAAPGQGRSRSNTPSGSSQEDR